MGRAAEVRERALQTLKWGRSGYSLLSIALDTLSLGRAAHALASAPRPDPHRLAEARRTLDAAVDSLRKAGTEDELPRGLLARAACLRDMGEWSAAARDLRETREIAERGEMRLFLTDWHLESARLLLAQLGSDPAPRRRPGLTPGSPRKSIWQRLFGSSASTQPAQAKRSEMGSDPAGLRDSHICSVDRKIGHCDDEAGDHSRERRQPMAMVLGPGFL